MTDCTDARSAAPDIEEIDVSAWEGPDKFAILLHNCVSPDDCARLIERSEAAGYDPALVNVGGGGQKLMTDVRNNDRVIIDDPAVAEWLYQRILAKLEASPSARATRHADALRRAPWVRRRDGKPETAVGLNERLRFLRYDPGAYFAPHYDGCYRRGLDAGDRALETSYVTCQLYLNEGFEGGATRFLSASDDGRGVDVAPRTGTVLLFQHQLCHEGALLLRGRKYTIRTDVMYTTRGEGHEYAVESVVAAAGGSRPARENAGAAKAGAEASCDAAAAGAAVLVEAAGVARAKAASEAEPNTIPGKAELRARRCALEASMLARRGGHAA